MLRGFELDRIYNWKQESLFFKSQQYVYHLI
jgi:hypothetical protein